MSRELDATIAEALGYSLAESASEPVMDRSKSEFMSQLERVPYYSTDGNAMLELDKEMQEQGWQLQLRYHPLTGFTAIYIGGSGIHGSGWGRSDLEPLARALSAYKALTGKEWVLEESAPFTEEQMEYLLKRIEENKRRKCNG